jgi:hypothetical protein
MPSNLVMDLTNIGKARISQISTNDLVFHVSHVAYGTGGYQTSMPTNALTLIPGATSLFNEIFRKPVQPQWTTIDTIESPRGKETTYTTVGGTEFTGVLGEAGLYATVSDPGTSGLTPGSMFLLMHAHFPRVVLTLFDRLAIRWPLHYNG